MWQIEFTSSDFLPYLPDDAQVNPGVYGFELAQWLSRALAEQGVVTSYPLAEDWGWLLEYIDGELEVMIGCSSMADEGEAAAGEAIRWSVFVKPHQSLKHRLFGRKEAVPSVSHLTEAIVAVLAAQGIRVEQVEA